MKTTGLCVLCVADVASDWRSAVAVWRELRTDINVLRESLLSYAELESWAASVAALRRLNTC